jgi:hypothetical protein
VHQVMPGKFVSAGGSRERNEMKAARLVIRRPNRRNRVVGVPRTRPKDTPPSREARPAPLFSLTIPQINRAGEAGGVSPLIIAAREASMGKVGQQ